MARDISALCNRTRVGKVTSVTANEVTVSGISTAARVGDLVQFGSDPSDGGLAEVIALTAEIARLSPFDTRFSPAVGASAFLREDIEIRPCREWIGRVVDAFGRPLDGRKLPVGKSSVRLWNSAPVAKSRRRLSTRLSTSFAILDTVLPLARGQRVGIFAGSGVGKTTLLGDLARSIDADCIVIGLVGERGRELNEFIEAGLGPTGLKRSVVIAATSDQTSLTKRRAALTATSIAEHFRDEGMHVLLILDSITRFAEAHREVALTAGETPSLRAYPPSTSNMIAALTERAGPGGPGQGDITAIYSILVAGSDMEEPVADMTRGLLDGHIVLDREIAERGRFPAIDVRRSVSRSLPDIASDAENSLNARVRKVLNSYEKAEPLIQTGLYVAGSDPDVDYAIKIWPLLDEFIQMHGLADNEASYELLSSIFSDE